MKNNCYSFRRIIFETVTAIHAGSGESDPIQDMPVQIDFNGLPIISSTSITGVLRHLCNNRELFGNSNNSGSRLIVSDAILLDDDGKSIPKTNCRTSTYIQQIKHLAWRDHCALTHRGTAKRTGKFDQTVLIAGVRFILEYCIISDNRQKADDEINTITELFYHDNFRLGGGTRNGLGKIKVVEVTGATYDLNVKDDKEKYLARSSSLYDKTNEPILNFDYKPTSLTKIYNMKPESFWLFSDGSGYGNLDIRPKVECKVFWDTGHAIIKEFPILPATSIKGALSHRTAYHYNKLINFYADKVSNIKELEKPNKAVCTLFGSLDKNDAHAGYVLISDITCNNAKEKVLNHVKIDRFTGGALEGALFTEQVLYGGDLKLEITILPFESDDKENILKAFNFAIDDLLNGRLPLGGGVMRGLGAMKGNKED